MVREFREERLALGRVRQDWDISDISETPTVIDRYELHLVKIVRIRDEAESLQRSNRDDQILNAFIELIAACEDNARIAIRQLEAYLNRDHALFEDLDESAHETGRVAFDLTMAFDRLYRERCPGQ